MLHAVVREEYCIIFTQWKGCSDDLLIFRKDFDKLQVYSLYPAFITLSKFDKEELYRVLVFFGIVIQDKNIVEELFEVVSKFVSPE